MSPKYLTPGVDDPGVGGGGDAQNPPASPPEGALRPVSGGGGMDAGGLTGIQDGYTSPDAHDGHRHAVLSDNFDEKTGIGVTEIEGGFGTSFPAHAHAIVGWFVEPWRMGTYESVHGSFDPQD